LQNSRANFLYWTGRETILELKGNAFKRLSVPQKRTAILEIALDLHQQRSGRQQGFHRMTVPRANMPCTFSCGARSGDFVTA
jgi:hypothetical protein